MFYASQPIIDLTARRLTGRYGLPPATARLLAEIVLTSGRVA